LKKKEGKKAFSLKSLQRMTTLGHQKGRGLLPLLTKCLLRSQGQKQAANNASCKRCLSSPPSAAEVDNSLGLPEQWKPPQEEGEAAVEDKQEASRYLQQLRRMVGQFFLKAVNKLWMEKMII
jgi:hypothetical protein